jgi:undecaprenyl-diphosphatase
MPLHQVIILAVIQGFTEFLPISSSAHLALTPWLFGWQDQGLVFDIALHMGTLAAVLLYFHRDWFQIVAQAFGLPFKPDSNLALNKNLLWLLAAASVPVAISGFLLKDIVGSTLRSPFVIGVMLILVAGIIWFADRRSKLNKNLGEMTALDCMLIGLAQALAIVPGTSRSGITIAAALFRDTDRYTAARFSFLLSTPAIAGAGLKSFLDLMETGGLGPEMATSFLIGMAVSAVTGCLVIAFFLRFLRRYSLNVFVYYRIVFGIIIITLALTQQPLAG